MLDYAGLWHQVRQLVAALRGAGLNTSARVAVVLPNGPEMAVVFLGVASCMTCAPLNPAYTAAEFRFFLEDTGAQAIVLMHEESGPVRAVAVEMGLMLIEIERGAGRAGQLHIVSRPVAVDAEMGFSAPDQIALILHTSGTTARPKIVPLTQAQLLASAYSIAEHLALEQADRCLNVMPLFHIHGLVAALLASVSAGASVICTPGFDELAFFDWIAQLQPSWTTAVPTMHQAWVARASLYREKAPAHRFRFVRSSSAALPPQTLRALQALTGAPVIEAYGMTEASHQMASNPLPPGLCKPGSVGLPAGAEIAVMNEAGHLLEQGAVGEIVVRGPGLTSGYENHPEANTASFHQGWFRTGDQGRLDEDGYLFITGRLKEIVNRGGEKISPREIDEVLLEHSDVLQAVAYGVPHPTLGEDLVAAVVLGAGAQANETLLRNFLFDRLAAYKVPSTILAVDAIPKGATGKIQRNRLHALLAPQGTQDFEPARSELEQGLVTIFGEVLGVEQPGIHANFFSLGGDSLKGTQVVARINSRLGVMLPATALFRHPTVRALAIEVNQRCVTLAGADANHLRTQEDEVTTGFQATTWSRERSAPVTPNQRGLWLLAQLAPDSAAYNISRTASLLGPLDVLALQGALTEMVRRHEVLRTRFIATDSEPLQIVAPAIEPPLRIEDLSGLVHELAQSRSQHLVEQEAQTPFKLDQGPLMRAKLLRLAEHEHWFVLTVHHIIWDNWSQVVFLRELAALYEVFCSGQASRLEALPMQFSDHAKRLRERLLADPQRLQLTYWKEALAELPALVLPTDRPRPLKPTYRGQLLQFSLDSDLTNQIRALSRTQGTTVFTTLLAAFQVLLYRHSAQTDFAIGVPVLGRPDPELMGLVGYFVNMLVIRSDLSGSPSFTDLLFRVRQRTTAAYEQQDVPFNILVKELTQSRDLSRNPLFQVAFTKWSPEHQVLRLAGLESAEIMTVETGAAQFDLSVTVVEQRGQLQFLMEYASDLFDAATIARMAGHFRMLLEGIVARPETPIDQLPLLTPAEHHQLLVEWNDTAIDYPRDRCIHQLFEEQVARTPQAVALVFENQQLSYRELDERANQLAHHLITLGVGPEVLVGICLERSLELIVGLLGILKAGAAYVPLEPSYPKERLAFMLSDTQAPVLLTQQLLLEQLPSFEGTLLCLDRDWQSIAVQPSSQPSCDAKAGNLAYVIYTSGSTGVPKGVIGTHQGIVNRLSWMWESIPFDPGEVCCQKTSLSFVDSICEIFDPLLKGVPLVVVSDEGARDVRKLVELLAATHVTRIVVVPALLSALLEAFDDLGARVPKLSIWTTSGEALFPELLRRFRKQLPQCRLINLYGASEVSADATWHDTATTAADLVVSIGRPIANTQIYIVDQGGQPVPVGVPGELHVGGAGLARGYLNRPELTRAKFVPDPFSTVPGARMYRTGDLARHLPDGNIEYLGRIDDQVKIHGIRIELGEIEEALRQYPAVQNAAVQDRDLDSGGKELVAFIINKKNRSISGPELRNFLGRRLPRHLLPDRMFWGHSLPLNANGKLDRAALKSAPLPESARTQAYQAPHDALQGTLLQIWSDLLNRPSISISINDNFFDLGGNSLKAVIMLSRVEKLTDWSVPLTAIYNHPTVKSLALAMLQLKGKQHRSPLIEIQSGTSGPPFFFMHGDMHGGGYFCHQLARNMGSDQAFYVIQPHGLPGRPLPSTIEEMAAEYLALIRASFPQGPYLLGGHCNGALVAFEMAQRLLDEGSKAELLVMMDPPFARGELAGLAAEARQQMPGRDSQGSATIDLDKLSPEERHNAVLQLYGDVCKSYAAHYYPGKLTLFLAKDNLDAKDPARGWRRMAATGEFHVVPGHHVSMLTEHSAPLAQKLIECRDKIKWD